MCAPVWAEAVHDSRDPGSFYPGPRLSSGHCLYPEMSHHHYICTSANRKGGRVEGHVEDVLVDPAARAAGKLSHPHVPQVAQLPNLPPQDV